MGNVTLITVGLKQMENKEHLNRSHKSFLEPVFADTTTKTQGKNMKIQLIESTIKVTKIQPGRYQ